MPFFDGPYLPLLLEKQVALSLFLAAIGDEA